MIRRYNYKKIDAFTSEESLGNPAACIYLSDEDLTEVEMLNIAKQHKGFVSEVVYCNHSDIADCKLIYYSSECEVDFCGHGTIAAMYELIRNDDSLLRKHEIMIETNRKGVLTVYNEINSEDAIYITAPSPQYFDTSVDRIACASALGLEEDAISAKEPISLIDAGLRTLIIPLTNYEDEISVFPCEATLREFCIKNDFDIILIFTKQTSDDGFIAHTRVFAPKFGYLEDPATGSGNSAFGYYMRRNDIWNGEPVAIEQGGNNRVFNTIKLSMKDNAVLFGGRATLRIDGLYLI